MLKPRWRFASTTIVTSVALLLAGCATTNSSFSTCDISRQLQPENSTSPASYDSSLTCRPRVETTGVRGERYDYSKAYKEAQRECARIQAEKENEKLIVVHPTYESGMIPEYSLTYAYAQRSGAAINAGDHYSHVIVAPTDQLIPNIIRLKSFN